MILTASCKRKTRSVFFFWLTAYYSLVVFKFLSWERHRWLKQKKKIFGSTFKCLTWHCFLLHKVVDFCERSKGPDFFFRPKFETCAQLTGETKVFFYRGSTDGGLTLKINTANQYLWFVYSGQFLLIVDLLIPSEIIHNNLMLMSSVLFTFHHPLRDVTRNPLGLSVRRKINSL